MEKRGALLLAGVSFAMAALFLWGTFRFGTAAELFPETEKEKEMPRVSERLPAEGKAEETETDEAPVLAYDSAAYRRDRPLPDPFRAEIRQTVKPAAENPAETGKPRGETRPRLCGILVSGEDRRAMLEWDGQVKTVREGERTGEWTVITIGKKQTLLAGPAGEITLSL